MNLELNVKNQKETEFLAKKLAKNKFGNMIVCLDGDLGCGKTFFSKSFAKEIGVTEEITSPTFTIIKEYEAKIPFNHIDVYRLNGDIEGLGLDEYFDTNGITFIEWASTIKEYLPKERLEIVISRTGDTSRKIVFKSYGNKYDELLEAIR